MPQSPTRWESRWTRKRCRLRCGRSPLPIKANRSSICLLRIIRCQRRKTARLSRRSDSSSLSCPPLQFSPTLGTSLLVPVRNAGIIEVGRIPAFQFLSMPNQSNIIRTPEDPKLSELCDAFSSLSPSLHVPPSVSQLDSDEAFAKPLLWPNEQLRLAGEYGVHAWFVPEEYGGLGWSTQDIVKGYLRLSASCLTTTFIITQRAAAIKRIVASENLQLKSELMPGLLTGEDAATVGISHLTTSRRHVSRPVLTADESQSGLILNGYSPWVTGGCGAKFIVIGAEQSDGKQVLVALPKDIPGVTIADGIPLLALTGSQTGEVRCDQVSVDAHYLLAGPQENVLATGPVSATGGFQTSALATGLAIGAIEFIRLESERRSELVQDLRIFQPTGHRCQTKSSRLGGRDPSLHERRTAYQRQQPCSTSDAGGDGYRQGSGLCCGTPGRTLVPGGVVLPRLELPSSRCQCQPVRTGRNRGLIIPHSAYTSIRQPTACRYSTKLN